MFHKCRNLFRKLKLTQQSKLSRRNLRQNNQKIRLKGLRVSLSHRLSRKVLKRRQRRMNKLMVKLKSMKALRLL